MRFPGCDERSLSVVAYSSIELVDDGRSYSLNRLESGLACLLCRVSASVKSLGRGQV